MQVLLLHRHLHHADVISGMRAALAVGSFTPDVVALEARKAAEADGRSPTVAAPTPPPAPPVPDPQVPSLTMRRVTQLPGDARTLPDLARWDQLLHRTRKDVP
ncbi:hypothetical protein ABTY96_47585 [Streptomyces sp. NPDC096057]|uniref:hypothetical protein n=1 Tax=Streptomyces sp. NPDC096057 TaxID=3155543 RepID=UPI00331BFD0D